MAASQLVPGLTVTLTLSDDRVVKVVIGEEPPEEPEVTEVEGLVLVVLLDSEGNLASLTLWSDDEAVTFPAAVEVDITRDGQDVEPSEILPGRIATVTLTDGEITVVVLNPGVDEVTTVEGTVTEITLGTGTDPMLDASISIVPEGGDEADEETYAVAPDATVTVNDEPATLGDVRSGDAVVLEFDAENRVTAVAATYDTIEFDGTVVGMVLDTEGRLATLTVSSGEEYVTLPVDPALKVYYAGAEVDASGIEIGDTVTVVAAREAITTVTITAKAGE